MLPISDAILQKTKSQVSESPMALVAVWADDGPEDRLVSAYRMAGNNDAGAAGDSNVAVDNQGRLTISTGSAVVLDTSTAASTQSGGQTWSAVITDLYSIVWA